mgnify:CR=1
MILFKGMSIFVAVFSLGFAVLNYFNGSKLDSIWLLGICLVNLQLYPLVFGRE